MTVYYRCQVCGEEIEVEGEEEMRYSKAKEEPPKHCDQPMIAW